MNRQTVIRRDGKYEKREFKSAILALSRCGITKIALRLGDIKQAWSAMSGIGTAGIEIEAF